MDLSQQLKPVYIAIDSNEIEAQVVNDLVASRVNPRQNALSTLTPSEEIPASSKFLFKRFSDQEEKKLFQKKLLTALQDECSKSFSPEDAKTMIRRFTSLAHDLEENGAIILGSLISKEKFEKLISCYSGILSLSGNESWIHNFVNLAQHAEFLADTEFNEAFLHPLFLALISYQIGGPIRMIDARAKNAEKLSPVIAAGDNMLHIDNTPFCNEFKVILAWEKDQPRGPKGQNLVFLPGTNKGVRKFFTSKDGACWSTENCSIFTNNESVENVLAFQRKLCDSEIPAIVEVTNDEKPLTTIFDAASVVHHRYRSLHTLPRSSVTLAFHRIKDNPGRLITSEDLKQCNTLTRGILGHHCSGLSSVDKFLQALVEQVNPIATLINDLYSDKSTSEVISMDILKIPENKIVNWKETVTAAPNVEKKKVDEKTIPLHEKLSHHDFIKMVNTMMQCDQYGPLDLILYSDNHEEIRKWARNKVREIKPETLKERLDVWARVVQQPSLAQLLTPQKCQSYSYQLADTAGKLQAEHLTKPIKKPDMDHHEHACSSIQQLFLDLGEAIVRCDSRQTFLSTALFLFLACDLLLDCTTTTESASLVQDIGTDLLGNYISTAILIATQIKIEQAL